LKITVFHIGAERKEENFSKNVQTEWNGMYVLTLLPIAGEHKNNKQFPPAHNAKNA